MQTTQNKNKFLSVSSETISKSCQSLKKLNNVEHVFAKISTPHEADSSSLVFANSESFVQQALDQCAGGLIVSDKLAEVFKEKFLPQQSVWTTANVHFTMTEVLPLFNPKTTINTGIHATAFVDPSAQLGTNVTIEPFAVIGKNVRVGNNAVIGAHCVLENDSSVGENTKLSSHVSIGFNCRIGNNCLIGPQTAIGSDGFGFVTDKQGQHHKIPQIGQVIIEDNCELGAQCAIDRAALTETRIKKGSKFDNFIHIAHNCEIGENAMITAGFIVAGSTKIGKNLTTAGGTHVVGHIHITDNVILTGRTGVVSSIDKPGIYGGFPHTSHKDNLKIMSSLASLPKIRKQMTQVLKHLGLDNENN